MSSPSDQAAVRDTTAEPSEQAPGPLEQRLRQIAAGVDAPEDALEPALQALCEAAGIGAAALCLYDAQQQVLRLTTDIGLSDEGCRSLRSMRQGAAGTWDVPLRSLLDRRAFLLDGSPTLPPLVEAMAAVTTIACVPVCAGATPIASLVLVASAPRTIEERDIRELEGPLRELVRIVDAARRPRVAILTATSRPALPSAFTADYERLRGEVAVRLAERAALAAKLTARTDEVERLRASLETATGERARLAAELEQAKRGGERAQVLAASLAASERERATLAESLQATVAEHAEQTRAQVTAVERAEQARAATEIERVRAESERARAAARAEYEAERERLEVRLCAAETALQQARATADAHAEVAAAQVTLEATAHRMASEVERLEGTQRSSRAERERLERELTAAQAAADAARTAHEELAREVATLREANDRAAKASREGAAATGALRTQLDELAAERNRLRESLAEMAASHTALLVEKETAVAELRRVDEAVTRESAERGRLQAILAMAEDALENSEMQRKAEAAERAAEIERLSAERDQLLAERGGQPATPAPIVDMGEPLSVVTLDEPFEIADGVPAPRADVSAAPATASETLHDHAPVQPKAPRMARVVVVIDLDPVWEGVTVKGHEMVVVKPDARLVEQLCELAPVRTVVNLAAPGAFDALAALRAGGYGGRLWGCIAAASHDRTLALGMIEPAARPLDLERLVATLGGYAQKGTRVVTAGTDSDALMSLRHALARQGLSVSMAWNGGQASDLLETIHPELVLIDLKLRGAHKLVAGLAGATPIPHAVLIRGDDDGAAAFSAALVSAAADATMGIERFLVATVAQKEPSAAGTVKGGTPPA